MKMNKHLILSDLNSSLVQKTLTKPKGEENNFLKNAVNQHVYVQNWFDIRVNINGGKQTSVYEPATMTQHASVLVLFPSQDDLDRTFGAPLFFQTRSPEAERFGSGLQTEQGGLNLKGTDPEEHNDTLRWCSPPTHQSNHPHC